ncbi:MAG: hypothetical protein VB064_11655 [Oscillospiraceae bacterium]|nr:hypothetical protein [Oscillospiraceae bacterium]
MTRIIDKVGRIYISQKWLECCTDSTAVITVNSGGLNIQPYDPQKHSLDTLLYRKLDDHARLKIPPDILKGVGFSCEEECHLYIGPDNVALVRRMGDYCDVCGKETKTKVILGRNVCLSCFEKLKRCE